MAASNAADALHHRGEIELEHRPARARQTHGPRRDLHGRTRAADHRFGRHTTDVQTVAAHEVLLDQCDLRSETRCTGRCDEARGARPDDDKVVGAGRGGIDPVRRMDVRDERLIMFVPGEE